MKVFSFLVSSVFFFGGIGLMGYAFTFAEGWNTVAFAGGLAGVAIGLAIPFHLLERFD